MVDTGTPPADTGTAGAETAGAAIAARVPPNRRDFMRDIVQADLAAGRTGTVVTRFPPEPNGYLHLGHAKSICLNFGIAQEFAALPSALRRHQSGEGGAAFHRRHRARRPLAGFRLGRAPAPRLGLFRAALRLGRTSGAAGKAYVDDTPPEAMRSQRGTLTEPGQNSPFRYRSVEENLDLFRRMRTGEFPNGARVLRAKIDMSSGNMNLRDPVLYRILHATHPRTGDAWCIYPTYDFAHGQSDAIEGISHSICTLESRIIDRCTTG